MNFFSRPPTPARCAPRPKAAVRPRAEPAQPPVTSARFYSLRPRRPPGSAIAAEDAAAPDATPAVGDDRASGWFVSSLELRCGADICELDGGEDDDEPCAASPMPARGR